MDKLFYIIFNSYYKKGSYTNDLPPLTVGGIFVVCFFCLGSCINIIFFDNILTLSRPERLALGELRRGMGFSRKIVPMLIASLITYLYFFLNGRFLKIHEKYKDDIFLNSTRAKFIGYSIVLLMIVSPFIAAVIKNKIYTGLWS